MTAQHAAASGAGARDPYQPVLERLGRAEAFPALFRAHHGRVVGLARLLVDDQPTAEDVVQDAFAAMYRRWHWLRNEEAAVRYLDRAVVTAARRQLKRRRVRAGARPVLVLGAAGGAEDEAADEAAVRDDDLRRVVDALAALPHQQREVLVLRYGPVTLADRDAVGAGTGSRLEDRLAAALRAAAAAAAAATDTEHELTRLGDRRVRDTSRRRSAALTLAACALLAMLVAGLVGRPSAHPAPLTDHGGQTLRLGSVPAPEAVVIPVALPAAAAPVALRQHADAIWPETRGRLWVVSGDPSTLEWSLTRLGPDHRTVQARARFAAQSLPWVTVTDDVLVLALSEGGPLPAAGQFSTRHDGLLGVDRRTGRVLWFTRVERVGTLDTAPDGSVWAVVAPDRVARLDPVSGRVLRTMRTPGLVDSVFVQGDRLWLSAVHSDPSTSWQVDGRTGRVLHTASMPGPTVQTRVGAGVVLFRQDGRAVRVEQDGSATAVQLRLPGGGPVTGVEATDGQLWLWAGDHTLVWLSGTTLGVDGAATLPWPGSTAVAGVGDQVFVADAQAGVVRRMPLVALIPR